MTNKHVVVTGANGGIGEAYVRQFYEAGYDVDAPVRKIDAAQELFKTIKVHLDFCADLSIQKHVDLYFENLASRGIVPSIIPLTAGTFAWDNDKRPDKQLKNKDGIPFTVREIAEFLYKMNVDTKSTVINSLISIYPKDLKQIKIIWTSSQAANFKDFDPKRLNEKTGYKEEGYIASMLASSDCARALKKRDIFGDIILDEPGLINTIMAQESFTLETIGEIIEWDTIPTPEVYVRQLLRENQYRLAA